MLRNDAGWIWDGWPATRLGVKNKRNEPIHIWWD